MIMLTLFWFHQTLSGLPTIAGASDWIEVEDPKDPKKSYWYNTVTQKTSATNPEGASPIDFPARHTRPNSSCSPSSSTPPHPLTITHALPLPVPQPPPHLLPSGAAGASASASADGPKTAKVSRMGGLLEPFKDINKGFQLFKPKVRFSHSAGANFRFRF
jgi:hypothetical protein